MSRLAVSASALLLALVGLAAADEPAKTEYRVLKKIPLGGAGGWDYLTFDEGRLYIARSNRVQVVDVEKGKLAGEVLKTPGVHGVALVPKRKLGFSSNGGDSTVTVFDLETHRAKKQVKVGERPDAILYDPASDRVFTFNARSKDATALSGEDGSLAGTVKLDGRPESAVADEKGMVYVNIMDKNEVAAVDAKKLTVKERWALGSGKSPMGIAMDRANRRLFVTCRNEKMVILDADNGRVLETLSIGKGTDAAAFDPGAGLAFSSNGEGTLTVVERQGDKYRVAANVKTQAGARTMALDPKTHNVYLVTARFKPPAAGKKGRGQMEPGSFVILVVGK
jgi:DNA-binding beta-propeller fold protein YncE